MKYRYSNHRFLAVPAFALAVLTLATGAHAATRFKADSPDALTLASSWDTPPGAADIASWGPAVIAANCPAVLGADLSWAGIQIVDPGDLVTIGGVNTLTLGMSGINLSTATQDLTIASGLTVFGKQSWKAAAGRTLDVTGAFTRNGATVDFTNFNSGATLGTLANVNGILGPWATSGSTTSLQYVTSTAGVISAYADATPAAPADLSDVTSDTTNYTYAAAATLAGNQSANTLRYTGGTATTITALGTNSLTLNGLMQAGSGTLTITSTAGNPSLVIGASGELDIISNDKTLNLSARITETSAGKVVYSAAGPITLAAPATTNNYTGGTVINSASLFTIVGAGTWFGSGPVTVNGGTMFISANTLSNDFTLNGGLVTLNNSFSSTLKGTITLAVPTTFQLNQNGNMVISGKVTGPGGLTKTQGTNNGPLQLTNAANDYAGPTTVVGGILQVKSSLYGNDTAKWTPANISVDSGATFALNIGATDDFSLTDAGTMLTNLLTSVDNNGLKAGSYFGLSTANATASVTFATPFTDSSGTGGGAVGLRKLGVNTLDLTGANTYSGMTRIDAGTLSINNIANIGATSSALGAPTTPANGTISIGRSGTGGTLLYTGAEQSTDRTIQIGTNSAAPVAGDAGGATIQNDGAGALTFSGTTFNTQTNTASGAGANRTLTLQGSNGGTISGIIRNNLLSGTATGTANVALAKAGSGTWILSGPNTYTGATTVSRGTLLVNNTADSGTGTGTVNVSAGTLGGDGFITGDVNIGNNAGSDDAILTPGNSIGSLDTGNLTFNSDGSYACEVNATSVTCDQVIVTGTVTIKAGTTLTVSLTGSPVDGQKYFIVSNNVADAVTGTFDGLAQDAVVGSYGSADLKISYTADSGTGNLTGGNDIVLYAVPPSPYSTWTAGPFTNPFTNTLPGVDFDNDGLSNLLEFVLGGDPTISQAGIAPTTSVSGGNLVLTFKRSDASELSPAVTVKVELSTDLTFSTPADDITVGPATDPGPIAPSGASYTVSNSGGFDTITVTIPQGAAPAKFARVKAIQTP
jgi:autotransporter-associated beta strand protein